MNEKKQNKNKIIIAVSVIIIFIILAIGVYFLISYLNKKVDEEKSKYRNYNETLTSENIIENNNLTEEISNEKIVDDPTQVIDKSFGKIEIVWVDSNNQVTNEPEKPVLSGMNSVIYNRQKSEFEIVNSEENTWYDYSKKQWANAIDENGSYFVWIPKYAYKIVYYSDKTYEEVIGYTDARGMLKVNKDGTLTRILNNSKGLKEVGNHYILHPAFAEDYLTGYRNSGWDKNINGIWIAKYESSMEENGTKIETENEKIGNVNISDSVKLVSKPSRSSWRNISIGNAYINGYNYNRQRESHLLKNTEWGAVAYLSYSIYGSNSSIIEINTSRNYLTGDSETPSEVYSIKKNEASNKNETGIYDLVGGIGEFISGYINNGNTAVKLYGGKLTEEQKSNKYKTLYENDRIDDGNSKYDMQFANSNFLLSAYLRGDALFETSNSGFGNYSWDKNSAFFVQQDVPFFTRGGDFASTTGAGLFSYNACNGQPNSGQGYRIALICSE